MENRKARSIAVFAALTVLGTSCQTGASPPARELAADQSLRVPIPYDLDAGHPLDPARFASSDVIAYAIDNNLFDGLYRYDDHLGVVPDIANGMPAVSSNGMMYTFRLKHGVRFWNGDLVTADDVLYSWNRAAAADGDFAGLFEPVVGYDAVRRAIDAQLSPPRLVGISEPDPMTVIAHLTAPAGYWLAELGLPAAWVVDHKAIEAGGEKNWWTTPDGLIGTGPFRMSSRVAQRSLVFSPVRNWWGDRTGALTRIEFDVDQSEADRWNGYWDGKYDILGFGIGDLGSSETTSIAALRSNPSRLSQLHSWIYGRTDWVGFNLQSGPFAGVEEGRGFRLALSQAIDRRKLAEVVCAQGTICAPATGGLITRGLEGYLGDTASSSYRFAPIDAKASLKRLDPSGSRLKGLVYYYNADPSGFNQAVASNLRSQWLANLGIDITIRGLDRVTFFTDRSDRRLSLFRGSWQADYDHPQDWFDNLFLSPADNSGAGYNSPTFSSLVAQADAQQLAVVLPTYRRAGQLIMDDAIIAPLLYYMRTVLAKPYVDGYGANALWEYRWTAIRILSH